MNLHEYQAKRLFEDYGIAVPRGEVVTDPDDLTGLTARVPSERYVVKAQVHAGGRGKAGGIKFAQPAQLSETVRSLLGTRLITHQSGGEGHPVNQVLVEISSAIANELYLAAIVDRGARRIAFIASTEGGMDIEEVAANTPELIHQVSVDPVLGLQPYQCRLVGFKLGLDPNQRKQLTGIMNSLYRAMTERDLSLVEINPLAVTAAGDLFALDAKVNVDENALYRQAEMAAMRDPDQEDARESEAKDADLSYVALDGNIGCMVNGAGLAMATMDVIKLHGGDPANFLDVGGTASKERVAKAFKLITADSQVKAVLVNIFGGIVRCDLIAEGILAAVEEVGLTLPVVVRLAGTNEAAGREILAASSMAVIPADDLDDAAQKALAAVQSAS